MNDSYFDIDSILASQRRVQCALLIDVPKLGFVDTGTTSDNLKTGTKLDLPCWLAEGLAKRRRPVLKVHLPKVYASTYTKILEADAQVVDLRRLGPFYYEFALQVIPIAIPHATDAYYSLIQTFVSRFRWLMDKASSATLNEKPIRMDKTEEKLFWLCQQEQKRFRKWLSYKGNQIKAAQVVKQRKRRDQANSDGCGSPHSTTTVAILLQNFSNPDGMLENGEDCWTIFWMKQPCVFYMNITLIPTSGINDMLTCSYKDLGQLWSAVANTVSFLPEQLYGSWYNPQNFTWKGACSGFTLSVEVYHRGLHGYYLIDNFNVTVGAESFAGEVSFVHQRNDNVDDTSFSFSYEVSRSDGKCCSCYTLFTVHRFG
ncbi:unnamed protein product [Soboliphyme baturini]|uniref:DNA replication complex GINS protein PSF3 n=1 Tax=Soboliphyme baturini TaxID=241478 RepID=A0A183IWP5_9BILA|nr:unnamed protein product [Soboliphyme baturini]